MIKRTEMWAMGLLAAGSSFLLCGYEMARSSANTLFKKAYGVENLPWGMALTPILLIALIALYGRLLTRFGPRKTFRITMLGSCALFLCCYMALQLKLPFAAMLLLPFQEAYIMIIVEQKWSFLNSTLDQSTAKKFNGPIIGCSSVGAIIGGLLLSKLAVPFGTVNMLLFVALSLLPSLFFADLAFRKCGEPKPREKEMHSSDQFGLSLFRQKPLLFLFLIVLVSQVFSAALTLQFQGALQTAIPSPDAQTAYSGRFFAILNAVAMIFQFVITPLALSRFPVMLILGIVPFIHVFTCGFALYAPSFTSIGTAFLFYKCLHYSLFRASKEILYMPLSFDARYRTKEVIDTFGARFGKGTASLFFVLLKQGGVVLSSFSSFLSFGAALLWLSLTFFLFKPFQRLQKISDQ
ncbi:MAG: hypothetical protein A3I05_04130 [Deltaproteobacteria bacterium RIFCSPLOWO2_02_FULL_44_10]|nr:MAG: hypothetical protein A3C46_03720 [Deltaproteobacteria bacterium RIFCSPHIGHO2_02_FULL_44_16]OGQ46334.1 MAG: hypothetical protein A3I05_04130 [Deltaproteobacteria bacterium RIFCSPLOWO2_02_FULL_44_10]